MSGVIRWEEPPPHVRTVGQAEKVHDWPSIVADLRSRPGEWALATVCRNYRIAGTVANALRRGEYASFGSGVFEAQARTVDGEARIYARYVGEAGSEATPNPSVDLRYVGEGGETP